MQNLYKPTIFILLCVIGISTTAGYAQKVQPRKNPVKKLLQEMTLNKKLTLLEGAQDTSANRQYQAGYLPGIPLTLSLNENI